MGFRNVSIKRFREEVDAIDDDFARILVKISYLTAGRASVLCTKTVPWELLNSASRRVLLSTLYTHPISL